MAKVILLILSCTCLIINIMTYTCMMHTLNSILLLNHISRVIACLYRLFYLYPWKINVIMLMKSKQEAFGQPFFCVFSRPLRP